MALGIYFSPKSMNAQQYDTCIRKLEAAGAGKPVGRLYHACFGTGDKLAVFDVWDSQQSFDRFGQTLMPILKESCPGKQAACGRQPTMLRELETRRAAGESRKSGNDQRRNHRPVRPGVDGAERERAPCQRRDEQSLNV